ncbi:hypothetical protein EJ03DRAFT_325048 [Teratosphaeria nubilosa]|uniref:Uncharacterized protein n=1 Tax=Teratosphaeria nubilosa TaxID=161662 RepID=A0A6G1LI20_9PEZI|nr:hypothetical protein EJ03DRAFT_325048 [Teratosphaeria nubilosa]
MQTGLTQLTHSLLYQVRKQSANVQCLWFINRYLTDEVPTPRLCGWKQHNGQTFVHMGLVSGSTLSAEWSHLRRSDKLAICQSLRQMIQAWRRMKLSNTTGSPYVEPMPSFATRIRSLMSNGLTQPRPEPSPAMLSQIDGSGLRDIMFHDAGAYPLGPFQNTSAFHDSFAQLAMRHAKRKVDARKEIEELSGLDDDITVVFTHNDLDMSNILVSRRDQGPVRIVAVIDWHQSGWYLSLGRDSKRVWSRSLDQSGRRNISLGYSSRLSPLTTMLGDTLVCRPFEWSAGSSLRTTAPDSKCEMAKWLGLQCERNGNSHRRIPAHAQLTP